MEIKTSWKAQTATFSKVKWLGAYSFCLTNPGNTELSKQEDEDT
jgi:hypothetical protein